MGKTTIYFVRHAESDHTVREDTIRPLTAKGYADALRITAALKREKIVRVYSSPYIRTIDTIRDLARTLELDIITIDDLRERKVGGWVEDFLAFAKKQWEDFSFKNIDGECLEEVQKRNVAANFNIIEDNPNAEVVVGTHGTVLSTIMNYFDPNFGFDDFYQIIDKMPFILCFTFEGRKLLSFTEIEF